VSDCPGPRPLCGCLRGKSRLLGGYAVWCREYHENAAPIRSCASRTSNTRSCDLASRAHSRCPAGGPICHRKLDFVFTRDSYIPSSISSDARSFAALQDQTCFAPVHLPSLPGRPIAKTALSSGIDTQERREQRLVGACCVMQQTLVRCREVAGPSASMLSASGGMFRIRQVRSRTPCDAPGHRDRGISAPEHEYG